MPNREISAALYVAAVVAGNGDARKVSNVLKSRFTAEQRRQLAEMARQALADASRGGKGS